MAAQQQHAGAAFSFDSSAWRARSARGGKRGSTCGGQAQQQDDHALAVDTLFAWEIISALEAQAAATAQACC
jgi:hypothetical protein